MNISWDKDKVFMDDFFNLKKKLKQLRLKHEQLKQKKDEEKHFTIDRSNTSMFNDGNQS